MSPTGYLIAALAAPAAGPVLYGLLHDRPRAARLLDGSVYFIVPLLVCWQVVPGAWEHRSALPLFAVGAGMLIPAWMERVSHALRHHTAAAALLVGLSGLLLHSLLEGAALTPLGTTSTVALSLALTLHRIAEGLVVWWVLRPRYGATVALAAVAALLITTMAGYALGLGLLADVDRIGVELYQAFVAGSLMHVVFHQGRRDHRHD
jgi:zinc transporter ZupT